MWKVRPTARGSWWMAAAAEVTKPMGTALSGATPSPGSGRGTARGLGQLEHRARPFDADALEGDAVGAQVAPLGGVDDVGAALRQILVLGGGEAQVHRGDVADQDAGAALRELIRLLGVALLREQRHLVVGPLCEDGLRHPAGEELGKSGDQVHQATIFSSRRSTCAARACSEPLLSITKVAWRALSAAGSWAARRARASSSVMASRCRRRASSACSGAVTTMRPSSPRWRPFSTMSAAS